MKKVFIFIFVLAIVLGVTTVFPIMAFKQLMTTENISMSTNEQGINIPTTMKLIQDIIQKGSADEVNALVSEYDKIGEERINDALNMFIGMSIIITILTITIGVLLNKKYSKVVGMAFITAGIIGIVLLGFFYYTGIANIVIF